MVSFCGTGCGESARSNSVLRNVGPIDVPDFVPLLPTFQPSYREETLTG